MEKAKSVAFTGYRESKLIGNTRNQSVLSQIFGNSNKSKLATIASETKLAIEQLHKDGCTTFYSGVSDGFDMIAAQAVLELKKIYPTMKLIAVVPFIGQECRYSSEDKVAYQNILSSADETVILAQRFENNNQYLIRNDYMLERSSNLICYYDGQRGGTMYTYNRAVKRGFNSINICKSYNQR